MAGKDGGKKEEVEGEERETGENDTKIQRRNRKYLSSQVCIRHVYL